MALVKAKVDCFLENGDYRKAGEQFDYKGTKNENLEPVKKGKADGEEPAADVADGVAAA